MRKVIDGYHYNTENAKLIGSVSNLGHGVDSTTDFGFWSASLYRTPQSGRYFVHGEGGAMTRWAQASGRNSWTGGEDLVPMSRDDAFEWAQAHLETDEVMAEFGDLVEDA